MVAWQEIPWVRNFQPEVMGAGNQNWSLAQAPSRFIYAGNTEGVLEFDGVRWKLLPLPDKQIVRAVAADDRGNIFCGGFGEFGYWRRDSQGILRYASLSASARSEKAGREEFWHILIAGGEVFFQSFSALYRYDYGTLEELPLPGNVMFMQEIEGKILLPVIGQGIFFKAPGGRFELLPGSEALGDMIISGMAALPGGRLLIGTDRKGLYVWSEGRLTTWDTPVAKQLSKSRINKILSLSDGSFAFGTIGEGLYIGDGSGRILYHIHRATGLQNNTVLALFEDRDGNLWAGLDKGMDVLAMNAPLRFSIDRSGNLGAVFTACSFEDKLYLGTNQGLFFRFLNGKATVGEPPGWTSVPGIKGQVWELKEVDGQLLCGHNDGSFLIGNGTIEKISDVTGGWVTRRHPRDNNLWVQGTYTGLIAFRKSNSGRLRFSHRIEGFDEPVSYLAFDSSGQIWAAHPYRGLHRLQLSADMSGIEEVMKIEHTEGLPTDFSLALSEINERLVLHAGERFLQWDGGVGRWSPFEEAYGYRFNGRETALVSDGPDHFFAVYPEKLVWVGPNRRTTFNLRLVNDRPNIVALSPDKLLFCLDDGYALLGKGSGYDVLPERPVPLITELVVFKNGASRAIDFSALSPGENAELSLASRENHLLVHFSLPVFDRKPAFRWRLSGVGNGWSPWQESGMQEFTYLPVGVYRFEVQSDQSEDIAAITLRIMPRWYQTWYSRLLFMLVVMAAGAGVLYWHRMRLERRHRRLMLERERQLHQQRIQERNEQLQEDVLKKAKDLANSTMQLIRKNELLLEIKQRLSDLKRESKDGRHVQQLGRLIELEISSENDWAVFEENFNSVHEAFLRKMRLSFPELTPGDLRLAAYLKMNLSSKEIAPLLGISLRGVENKRYRLRKKMGLPNDENLVEFLLDF